MTGAPPKAVIVMPTYNERGCLEAMVEALAGLAIPRLTVLVVDDNSPDGTGDLADQLAMQRPGFVSVLHRPGKQGLGTAYKAGFQRALDLGAERVFEMDADFSHPVAAVPQLLEASASCDFVVGSRFTGGASLGGRWGLGRRLLSWGGNGYSRLLTGLPVVDTTAGFSCIRREVLEAIDLPGIKSEGFAFQVELKYLAHRRRFRICEVPIHFAERRDGKSKMSFAIMVEAFWRVLELRLSRR